jgi:hypothetical protein
MKHCNCYETLNRYKQLILDTVKSEPVDSKLFLNAFISAVEANHPDDAEFLNALSGVLQPETDTEEE